MKSTTHKTILAVSMGLVAVLNGAATATAQSNLRMQNNTGYDIYELRLSRVNDTSWPSDLLGPLRIFSNGNAFTVTDIEPGRYDLQLVDQDADTCTLHNVPIYHNLSWNLSKDWLLRCEQ